MSRTMQYYIPEIIKNRMVIERKINELVKDPKNAEIIKNGRKLGFTANDAIEMHFFLSERPKWAEFKPNKWILFENRIKRFFGIE